MSLLAPSLFDFFSGCGGVGVGFREAGFRPVYALDVDSEAAATYRRNFPEAVFEWRDITEMNLPLLEKLVLRAQDAPIVFSGCAPCQPFSRQNTIRPEMQDDKRVPLILRFGQLVERFLPDAVFVENVPGFEKMSAPTQPFGIFRQHLQDMGYSVAHAALSLARYGVPQARKRMLLVASRHEYIALPAVTHGPNTPCPEYRTVRDSIWDLPALTAGESHPSIPNHKAPSLTPINLRRIRATLEGGGNRDLPDALRLACHQGQDGFSDVYGRMVWDGPANSLTTRCTSYTSGRFGHPEQDRAISLREAARIQTFPDDFVFEGSMGSASRQIGNAVPPRAAYVLATHLSKHLGLAPERSAFLEWAPTESAAQLDLF